MGAISHFVILLIEISHSNLLWKFLSLHEPRSLHQPPSRRSPGFDAIQFSGSFWLFYVIRALLHSHLVCRQSPVNNKSLAAEPSCTSLRSMIRPRSS